MQGALYGSRINSLSVGCARKPLTSGMDRAHVLDVLKTCGTRSHIHKHEVRWTCVAELLGEGSHKQGQVVRV